MSHKASPPESASSKNREKPGFAARRAALKLISGILERHQQLSDLGEVLEPLAPADRARANRLALTTLRHIDRADAVIGPLIERKLPLAASNVLRLATVELLQDGAAAHAVVDGAVSLMRLTPKTRSFAGLANAVLRKISQTGPDVWGALPPTRLRGWLRRRLVHIYDEETVVRMEAVHAQDVPVDLTLKDSGSADEWAQKLGANVLPTGSLRLQDAGQLSALDGYEDGDWWVQDAAAALCARLLDVSEGERVLDLCAAPGGKTMQLAAAGADVTALDISNIRLGRVSENLKRTGLTAELVCADALSYRPEEPFDAILLDAPCSATGTIRRHPDLPFAKNGRDLHQLFELQAKLIDQSVALLRSGGRLVYCTCSLLTEEGEIQIKSALERHELDVVQVTLEGVPADWIGEIGGIRTRPDLWPEYGGLDGFFMVALQKR